MEFFNLLASEALNRLRHFNGTGAAPMTSHLITQALDELENVQERAEQLRTYHGDKAAEVANRQALLAESQGRPEDHQTWLKVLILIQEK